MAKNAQAAAATLNRRIAALPTSQLVSISKMLATARTDEEIIVSAAVEAELERRLPEGAFLAHMADIEKRMDEAA